MAAQDQLSDIPPEWLKEAEEGDVDKQLAVGSHYLSVAEVSDEEKKEKAGNTAVFWLIRSSKQGNAEATGLLKKCLQTGVGVTDENREDIKWCVQTSAMEKRIRNAAKSMFSVMNTAHKEVLLKEEYIEAVKKLAGGNKMEEKLLLAAGKKIGDEISETEFAKVLSKKIQGNITLASDEMTDTSDAYQTASLWEKIVRYPKETTSAVADQVLEYTSKEGLKWLKSCIPTNQIYLFCIFFLYGFVTPKLIFTIVPLLIFYISFGVMIVTTLQMFYKKKKLNDSSTLAGMLKHYDVGVDVDQTQSQYTWNSLTPYLLFFSVLPLTILSFSLADKSYIPCAEISALCLIFSGICFTALSDSHDLITLMALSCNFLSSLPTFFQHFPDIPVITFLLRLFTGSLVSFELIGGFCFNIGIPSLSYIAILIVFIKMAASKSWVGTYRVLIPHLICYFWWNLMTSVFPFTTWWGIARATVGYLLLPVFVPLSFLLFIIFLISSLISLMQTELFGKIVVTAVLLSVPILLTQSKKLVGAKFDEKYRKFKIAIMVVFSLIAILPLIFVQLPSLKQPVEHDLSWNEYSKICGVPSNSNRLSYQMKCGHLIGKQVNWVGTFKSAKITKVENKVAGFFNSLPEFIANPLRCMYGEYFPECNNETMTEQDFNYCQLTLSMGRECHVKKHDVLSLQISIEVKSDDGFPITLSVDAGNGFRYKIVALTDGDQVKFDAVLTDGLGTVSPSLKLKKLDCISRQLNVMEIIVEDEEEYYFRAVHEAVSIAFNFFWYPLVEYRVQN